MKIALAALLSLFITPSYACTFDSDYCRPNPLLDSNERRLERIERDIRDLQVEEHREPLREPQPPPDAPLY